VLLGASTGFGHFISQEVVQMLLGKVKWFNDAKGYGFITHEDGRDVFVHYSIITGDGFKTLLQGQEVEYEVIDGPKGLHASLVLSPIQDDAIGNVDLANVDMQEQALEESL